MAIFNSYVISPEDTNRDCEPSKNRGEMPRNMEMKLDLKKANKKGIELIEPRKNGALTSNTEDPWTRNAV